ncbi:conserved hypothetical protein [uncultured Desulfatiglans sp.]|uniref:PIN domain-containing protein n=1 Tax=Uncultured Desulfatiglans sp. TaxID=1748965 RepID=A0A653A7S1_UNCDX|nr:conserved hypothetical protein [uncultured Desulfatiglans sp.]
MKLLLDTHVLLWAAGEPEKLSVKARSLLTSPQNTLLFSAASIWEIVIKLGRILIAQAKTEGISLLSADANVLQYGESILRA